MCSSSLEASEGMLGSYEEVGMRKIDFSNKFWGLLIYFYVQQISIFWG